MYFEPPFTEKSEEKVVGLLHLAFGHFPPKFVKSIGQGMDSLRKQKPKWPVACLAFLKHCFNFFLNNISVIDVMDDPYSTNVTHCLSDMLAIFSQIERTE